MDATFTFGQWLKSRRQALDLTQAGLAEAIGCAPDTIRSMEAGRRRPSQQLADLLAVVLNVSPDERQAFLLWARGLGGAAPRTISGPPLSHSQQPGSNLPIPPTPLIGREHEITLVRAALWRASTHLVTLSGPPGIGKTRLALAVAERVEQDFGNGVCFVSLAPITEPDLVAGTIARSLDVHVGANRSAAEAVMQHLRGRQQLLLLDNFEQVVGAARLVADLLASSPRLKVLVTSRIALHLRGEREIIVPPLALPMPGDKATPSTIEHIEAVTLFVERAQDAQSNFALTEHNARAIADICVRLDGLPLAIELAAAKVKLLSLSDLLSRLDDSLSLLTGGAQDLPGRHQTLRNAIQSSYDLLSPRRQHVFRWLGIFVSPFGLQAAERVADANLDDVSALVDASMIQRQEATSDVGAEARETRYNMLAMLREFAVQELEARGELDVARRMHADYFAQLANTARSELRGANQALWMEKLTAVLEDIRAALSWSIERGAAEQAMRIAGALWNFWYTLGYFEEGRQWLERALALPGDVALEVRGQALHAAGTLAWARGDLAEAENILAQALALRRETGDKTDLAHTLNNLGLVAHARGEYEPALVLLLESLELRREFGDLPGVASSLGNVAMIAYVRGDYAQGMIYLEEGLALRRRLSDKYGLVAALNDLAAMATAQGDYLRAQQFADEALPLARVLGDKLGVAYSLGACGFATRMLGDYELAEKMIAESLMHFQEAGHKVGVAEAFEHMAAIAAATGRLEKAARLYGAAEALRKSIGIPKDPPSVPEYERSLAAAREQADARSWKMAWAEGQAMSVEQAASYAVEGSTPC